MKSVTTIRLSIVLLAASICTASGLAKGDDFNSVVKLIEQFYNVKHEGLPFLAKAAMKAVGVGAKIKGGEAKRFAEAGSIKLATFEDQDFDAEFTKFRQQLNEAMNATWVPLVQTISATEGEQSYVFVRDKGDKFTVLVVNIEPREAVVVQANVSPKNLALLLKNPEEGAKAIQQEASIIDNE
jgi:hypothetical protein